MLRRRHENERWFVIEDGRDVHLELTLDTARRIVRAVVDDPHLRAEFDPPGGQVRGSVR